MKGLSEDWSVDPCEDIEDFESRSAHRHHSRRNMVRATVAGLLLLAVARHLLHPTSTRGQTPMDRLSDSPFHWKQCTEDPHYHCGYLVVPLDYTNASDSRTVSLATTLYQPNPASKSNRTLIIEPGGPGGSGTEYVWRKGANFSQTYTDGTLDVLGFDPRACFPSDAARDRWDWARNSWPESKGYGALQAYDAMLEATMKGCGEVLGDLPRFLTTAFVARDVDALREALGEEKLTGYMVSYGTGIGQTYAQMFPDKVGHLVLDGMENARDGRIPWQWGTTSLDNVTAAFEDGFIGECVRAGETACALATSGAVGSESHEEAKAELSARVRGLIRSTLDRPIPGVSAAGPGVVTYEDLVEYIYRTLYRPATWSEAAKVFHELELGNATAMLDKMDPDHPKSNATDLFPDHYSPADPRSEELSAMVICGDSFDAEKKPIDFWMDLHGEMVEKSWISGTPRLYNTLACRHFNWTVAETYRGDFNNTLANPIILIGSTYDPATPLRNGQRLAEEMGENARMVVHHGYGHASNSDPSRCTNELVKAYILEGTIPKDAETHCYADKKPYDEGYSSIMPDEIPRGLN